MKKVILSIAALTCSMLASAQMIAGYNATSGEGTYTELDNPTVVNTGVYAQDVVASCYLQDGLRANGYNKSISGEGFDIGFTFPFDGEEFTHFGIYSSGGIRLGKQSEMSMTSYSASGSWINPSGEDFDNAILFHDAKARSYSAEEGDTIQIQYQTIGEEGSRELVVEFKNLAINAAPYSSGTELVGTYSMQFRLSEDGKIAIALKGLSEMGETTAGELTIGLRGVSDYVAFGPSFAELTKKFNNSFYSSNAPKLVNVADGFTISFTSPTDVVTPSTQPSDIEYSMNGQGEDGVTVQASFTPAEGADRTLLVLYDGTPDVLPVDGVAYTPYAWGVEGDKIGSGKVWLASEDAMANMTKLAHNTAYTLVAYAYNSYGANGPKYNTVDPASVSFITTPAQPQSVSLESKTANSITVNVEGNEDGDMVFVGYNNKTYLDNYGARGFIGTPDASLQAGDQLYIDGEEAGKVAYFGPAGEFTIDDLEASTPYYLTVYSYNPTSEQFSCGEDSLHLHTSTVIVPTYELDLSDAPWNDIPAGWTTNKEKGYSVQRAGAGQVASQTEGNRVFSATRDKNMALELKSPEILLPANSEMSFDFHIHAKGAGYMGSNQVYDEWEDEDELQFLLYVEGESEPIVLKKYDASNPAEFEAVTSWLPFTVDLSEYAGKTVNVAWSFKCVSTMNVYFGMENFKVVDTTPTGIKTVETVNHSNAIYNLQGQRVSEGTKGIVIVNGKKIVK